MLLMATWCAVLQPGRMPERDQPLTQVEEDSDAGTRVHEAPPPRYGDRVVKIQDGGVVQ
jgi:hypothetical protein